MLKWLSTSGESVQGQLKLIKEAFTSQIPSPGRGTRFLLPEDIPSLHPLGFSPLAYRRLLWCPEAERAQLAQLCTQRRMPDMLAIKKKHRTLNVSWLGIEDGEIDRRLKHLHIVLVEL